MVNSIRKGAAFERRISVTLSLWASKGRREDLYWRTASSGGRATLYSRKTRDKHMQRSDQGDITITHPDGQFLMDLFQVECKNYRCLELDKLALGNKGLSDRIWNPYKDESNGRVPMVIAGANRCEPLLLTTRSGAYLIENCSVVGIRPTALFPRHGMYVYLFKDFLQKVAPDDLRRVSQYVERYRRRNKTSR